MPVISAEYRSETTANKLFMDSATYTIQANGENNIKYAVDTTLTSYEDSSGTLLSGSVEITPSSYISFVSDKGYMILEISTEDTGVVFGTVQTKEEKQDEDISLNSQKMETISNLPTPANTIWLFGDSLTANVGGEGISDDYNEVGWFTWANMILGGRFTLLENCAVGGDNSEAMLDIVKAKLETTVRPAYASIMIGVNDLNQSLSAVDIFANIQEACTLLIDAGIKIILSTVTPASYLDATKAVQFFNLNKLIKDYALTTPNLILTDMGSSISDPEQDPPRLLSGTTQEGIHPNSVGATRMGRRFAEDVQPHIRLYDSFGLSNFDEFVLNQNACMTGDTAGKADTYNFFDASTLATYTKETREYKPGEMQVIELDTCTNLLVNRNEYLVNASFSEGDKVVFQVEMKSEITGDFTMNAYIRMLDSGGSDLARADAVKISDGGQSWMPDEFVLKTPLLEVPIGTARIRATIEISGSGFTGTLKIGRFENRIIEKSV